MEESLMKISIPNSLMRIAARKGSLAAMTPEANNKDQLVSQPTLNHVRISVDDKVMVIESTVQQVSSRAKVAVDSSIKVDETGSCCVKAEWLLKTCCESVGEDISITLEDVPMEKVEKPKEGEIYATSRLQIRGTDKEKGKVRVKWSTPAIAGNAFVDTNYDGGSVIISCKAGVLKDIVNDVIFAANTSDHLELLDNVAILREGGKVIFATCDGKRSALRAADKDRVSPGKGNGTTLVKALLLNKAAAEFGVDEDVVLMDAGDGHNVILKSENLEFKIAMAPVNLRKKFPSVQNMMAMQTTFGIDIPKNALSEALVAVAATNSESGKYSISLDNKQMVISSSNEEGDTCESIVDLENVPEKNLSKGYICISTTFFQDMVKKTSGNTIRMSFTEDEKKTRIEDPSDPSYTYIMMRMLEGQ
jgi:DNA polymerase III sliding clamp (beta) subunit (PCNA family)